MITLTRIFDDHGSIVRFQGTDEKGRDVVVAVDHRMAQAIAEAIDDGEEPLVEAESWQISYFGLSVPS